MRRDRHRSWIRSGGRAALAFFVSVTALATPPDDAPAPRRHALLIGVNEYVTDSYPDLRGARNDVETMREILVRRFGFAESDVIMLTDEKATRAGIFTALDRLVDTARPADVVYIHFSGHGSQVEDFDGDEDDGKDETILPHDARTEGIADITDDELGLFLARLPARTAVVTLDSCHSGTATRGSFLARSVPEDSRLALYRKSKLTPRAIVPFDRPERHVLMTAAAAHQLALDGPADGRMHGFFTYALSQSLQSVGRGATPNDLHPGIQRTFDHLSDKYGIPVPEPQIEGATDRLNQPLFGTPVEAAARPWAAVRATRPDRARLIKGATLNAQRGSYWAIYPPGEARFEVGRAIALGEVIALENDDALITIEPAGKTLATGFRAVQAAPAPTDELFVRLTGLTPERATALERAIRRHAPDVTFVAASAFAHFDVTCAGNPTEGVAPTCDVRDAAGVAVLERVAATDLDTAGARLGARFSRALNAATLLALANPLSSLQLDVALVGPGAAAPRRVWQRGEPLTADNSLLLEIRASRDCYLTIVDVDAEGGINVLFPTPHAEPGFLPGGRLAANRTVRIPDSTARDNAAGFHWPFAPPGGFDTVQVFATTDRATTDLIRARVAAAGAPAARAGGATTAPRGHRGLEDLRGLLAAQVVRRGTQADDAAPAADWTSAAVRVRIAE